MKFIYNLFIAIHVAAGTLSLISFWIPAFTKKGGRTHILAGKFYVLTMWIVVISAMILCGMQIFNQNYVTAAFLGFLSILTANPLWYAIIIIKYKKRIPNHVLNIRRTLNLLLTFGGAGLIVWSLLLKLQGMTSLLLLFGILGLTSVFAAVEPKEKTRNNTNWLWEHISGMTITGIAAYTAFFAFGGRALLSSVLTGSMQIIPWILPTFIGVISLRLLRRKWNPA